MNLIGQWKVSAVLSAAGGEMKWVTREEAEKIEDFDLSMFDAITEFRPDGTVCDLIRIPQGTAQAEIDKAVAEGCEVVGSCIVAGKYGKKRMGRSSTTRTSPARFLTRSCPPGLRSKRMRMGTSRLWGFCV